MQRLEIHVFTDGSDARTAVEGALRDRRLSKIRASYFGGDLAAAARKYETESSPDLLIVETHETSSAMFEQLQRLSEVCRTETNLILAGIHNDVALYRHLIRNGVHEYVPLPADPTLLADAILALRGDATDTPQGRLLAFIGASGGAGSSTVAGNVAWQLGHIYRSEVALADLDLPFGTLGLDVNRESPQSAAQALAQAERLDDQMLERFLVKYDDNLALLTSAADCMAVSDTDIADLDRLLEGLRRSASWVVVDLPRSWSGWTRHVLDAADEIVITAVPTLASLRNARAAADALNGGRQHDTPVRLVLNRVGASPKTEVSAKDFAATFGASPMARLPNDPAAFAEATMRGHILSERARAPRLTEPLRKLAVAVSGRREPERRGGALWARFLPSAFAWAR
jgi:pilus assembly protein CpaE